MTQTDPVLEHRVNQLESAVIEIRDAVKVMAESVQAIARVELSQQYAASALDKLTMRLEENGRIATDAVGRIAVLEKQGDTHSRALWAIAIPVISGVVGMVFYALRA